MVINFKSEYVREVVSDETILAVILRTEFNKNGIDFFTANNSSQQLGYMKRPTGYIIEPHVHNPVKREVSYTKEVLFIKSGKVRVDFYDNKKKYLESEILKKGDVILLAYGGHGFEILEAAEMIEVKQGPYAGEKDKTRFKGIRSDQVTFKNN
tara:strand:- start:230 stop:688 length:459 start_codon:yes stop_codon:yes gene_type:complete